MITETHVEKNILEFPQWGFTQPIEFLSTFHVQALSFWMTDLNTFTQSKSSNMNSE